MHEPSLSHSRPLFGCFCGTFSPSRRQIRSMRLTFPTHPGVPQHGCDPSIAVTAVLGSERDDVGGQSRLIITHRRNLALGGSMLAKNPTRKALGKTMLGNHMIHAGTTASGAYQFPEAASLRISFSSVRSETARRN